MLWRAASFGDFGPLALGPDDEHPWAAWRDAEAHKENRLPGAVSRWSAGKTLDWRPMRPDLVVEVAYDAMDWGKARGLLLSALRMTEIGPDARASVTRRMDLWSSVDRALHEGLELAEKGDAVNARSKLELVPKLEPNDKNGYRVKAESELQRLRH